MARLNIVLYQPEIPGNTGNIIRTCLATNAKLHLIKPLAFDLHPKWIRRAAAGRYLSDIEHEVYDSHEAFVAKHAKTRIFYVTRYAQNVYSNANFKAPGEIFLMFGRESTGLPQALLSANLATTLRIPMAKEERSLNLANCVSILVYEVLRQNDFDTLSLTEVQKGADYLLRAELDKA